jgi:hypothetical protein
LNKNTKKNEKLFFGYSHHEKNKTKKPFQLSYREDEGFIKEEERPLPENELQRKVCKNTKKNIEKTFHSRSSRETIIE